MNLSQYKIFAKKYHTAFIIVGAVLATMILSNWDFFANIKIPFISGSLFSTGAGTYIGFIIMVAAGLVLLMGGVTAPFGVGVLAIAFLVGAGTAGFSILSYVISSMFGNLGLLLILIGVFLVVKMLNK